MKGRKCQRLREDSLEQTAEMKRENEEQKKKT
jgi:hypothetical protein